MNNWTESFKSLLASSHKQHIIVADQDELFDYDELKVTFEDDGFVVLHGKTSLEIRLLYELRVRGSEQKYLIVAPGSYVPLPDILQDAHFQSVGMSKLFPNLDSKAIKGLSYNSLCLISKIKYYEELGYDKTLKLLLENLYNIDFDTLKTNKAKERVLNALIIVLLEKNGVNRPLIEFLSNLAKPYFPELIQKGLNKNHLIQYLNDEWKNFVNSGQSKLDFRESVLHKNMGYLFALEILDPVQVDADSYNDFEKSLRVGIYIDEKDHNDTELEGLISYLQSQIGSIDDIPEQWFNIIQVLSNAKVKYILSSSSTLKADYLKMEMEMNNRFQRFINVAYLSLFSLSGVRKPVVVSRILEHMRANAAEKKALLVIDGMTYWQWDVISKALVSNDISFGAGGSLAYIPTITAWSRQAIFKGEKPELDKTNSQEAKLFESFWMNSGLPSYQIDFKKFSVNKPLEINSISDEIKVLGLVCNDLDEIMHGSILGNDLLKIATEHWVEQSSIVQIIKELKSRGFTIFITSDHGSTEAIGVKNLKLNEKVGAISRGKRHIQFTNQILFDHFIDQNPNLKFGTRGLSIYLKNDEAFTQENTKVITHGGSHIWEVIVPFITI